MARRTISSGKGSPFEGKIRGYYTTDMINEQTLKKETQDVNRVSTRTLREYVYKKTGSKDIPNSLSRQQLLNIIKNG